MRIQLIYLAYQNVILSFLTIPQYILPIRGCCMYFGHMILLTQNKRRTLEQCVSNVDYFPIFYAWCLSYVFVYCLALRCFASFKMHLDPITLQVHQSVALWVIIWVLGDDN